MSITLKGAFTAIVTPFKKGKVDFEKLAELVEFQISAGIDGLVPVGTTGESPTLSIEEHIEVIKVTVETAKKRCLIIAGTGANSTAEAIHLTLTAKDLGVDASLQVTPYYNKPSQEGLYRHFMEIAEKCQIPIVLYNIPGRCGVPIAIETIAKLAKNNLFVAVKEAGGCAERVSAILDQIDITVLSGDDSLTLPMMSLGAKGVISVASNIIPSEVKKMVDFANANDFVSAMKINKKLYPLFRDLFIETNPIPIKAAMAMKGMIEEEYRLPLCEMSQKNREILRKTLENCGII
ncbi:MAG TPA: 4-hydroxy-tetrahydrodipicolinate synthase [Victivallales bacterium]|nr:4-hydroxy-tetrahydrodipicolinate synthase [Victivallales bacterium]HRU00248.1 4-hydroxy-tetrahydrodipicolinate synthase [Victivallales bacterium]